MSTRPQVAGETIMLDGFKELMRAIRKMEPTLRKEMRVRLKTAGQIVSDEAKARARGQGLYATGKLVRSVRVGLRARSVDIVVGARRKSRKFPKGYNYPKRYEYGEGGKRAFLRPALAAKREEAVQEFAKILDELANVWQE
ncbi:MAG: hypothetical protein DDT38_01336 [Firmicutes bacterium]|nr:hypothetical protein [candidate division NPL-UPA2 bacterium]